MLASAVHPVAADTPAKPPGCTAAAHRQFDFWLGDWDVTDAKGKTAGRNRIVSLHDGCVLQESWSGTGGFSGTSLNGKVMQRITWERLADGRVRQLWESSKNGGTTWTVAFDGYYARR
ncbi:MAG: hypothetical protein ABJB78_05170 [Betaproteobacteria bacterium]